MSVELHQIFTQSRWLLGARSKRKGCVDAVLQRKKSCFYFVYYIQQEKMQISKGGQAALYSEANLGVKKELEALIFKWLFCNFDNTCLYFVD